MNDIEKKLSNNDEVRLKIVKQMQEYDVEDLLIMLNTAESDAEDILSSIQTLKDFEEFEASMDFLKIILWHIWALNIVITHKKSSTEINEEVFLKFIDRLNKM